ncbi:MAG: Fe-S cluster assembly protein SufD [Burkholderiales bacterium]|nr:Fe-S cluster assembly protein SufD [Burkholderiales bacterium]
MKTEAKTYLASLLAAHPALPGGPAAWLARLRAAALERANALTVPTTRDEDWRFTDLSPLYKTAYERAAAPAAPDRAAIEQRFLPEAGGRLVFVDGHYSAELSTPQEGDAYVGTLAGALRRDSAQLEAHLARHVDFEADPFAAVNTAFLQDCAVVHVPGGRKVERPVQLLFVATQAERVAYPRVLAIVERGAELTLVEDYLSLTDAAYFVNGVTELAIAENASLAHVRVQRESDKAFHIASSVASLARDARYAAQSVSIGARISRLNHGIRQGGEGTDCLVDGLALIAGRQLADTHSFIDHAHPHGRSRQLHKCVVDGAGHAVFNGRILVRKGAQLTDSAQSSRNLLLTGRAHVDTKPQLEILADDVKCAHGATVGQLDPEHVFYLRSRGLSEVAARNLLTYAFAAEVVDRIPVASLRGWLEAQVVERTHAKEPGG